MARIRHIALSVKDIDQTADFYEKARDPTYGGFFTYLDRQGNATSTNNASGFR